MNFIVGFMFGVILMFMYALFADNPANIIYARLEAGEIACKDHGGLSGWNFADEFTCKDGTEISNFNQGERQ